MLRQGDAKVFKKYSQMKLQMKHEALAQLNRRANGKGGSTMFSGSFLEPPAGIEPATC